MNDIKILLVVAEERFNELAMKYFAAYPVQLLQTRTLESALAIARREHPGLVLIDADLPGFDAVGWRAAFKTDNELSALPVVALASSAPDSDAKLLEQAGFDDILAAPLERSIFFDKLRSYDPRFERREIRVPYYAHVTIKDEDGVYYGMTGDISGVGLFVATFDRLPANNEIVLSFSFPEQASAPVEAKGRVVWLNSKKHPVSGDLPEGFGVEFIDLSPEKFLAIKEFIESAKKKSRH